MCGIFGAVASGDVAPLILDALKRLEYRGYDSAGIATVTDNGLERRRATGKLEALARALGDNPLAGTTGIGHTRWATHGAPTLDNAHPHASAGVYVVHNGIIENHARLRRELEGSGYSFASDTDTEVIAHLAARSLAEGYSPGEAARRTIARLEGAYAVAFLFEAEPDRLYATRRGSPMALGLADDATYMGSDAIALAPLTRRIIYLEEGDFAELTSDGVHIEDEAGRLVNRPVREISIDATAADKGVYRHYMRKEIDEQVSAVARTVRQYLSADLDKIQLPDALDLRSFDRVLLVACGTAYYACLTAKYWFEQEARLPVDIDVASEFRYREPPIPARTLAIFVSQSGETADTLAALRYVKGRAAAIACIVNATESSIARESDIVLPILAGPEIGVASTKAFTCQLTVLALLALAAGEAKGHVPPLGVAERLAAIRGIGAQIEAAIGSEGRIEAIAQEICTASDAIFLGRGIMHALALEGALKLKEISYIHAEGYASGELKHGPIALIDAAMPVIVLAPDDALLDKSASNAREVMARHGKVILVGPDASAEAAGDGIWHHLPMARVPDFVAPIVYAVPMQLLAYHVALAKGTDIDQPRNLAKSVTVE